MLYGIQYLRGAAALLVVFYHARINLDGFLMGIGQKELIFGKTFLDFIGKSGVDMFFVISGVVISLTISKIDVTQTKNIQNFIIRRIIRLTPIFWIVLFAHIAITTALLGRFDYRIENIIASAFYLPSVNSSGVQTSALIVSWTLNYEMLFYMSIAAWAVMAGRFSRLATCLQFVIFALLFYALDMRSPANRDIYKMFLFNPQALEFTMGVVIGWLYQKRKADNVSIGAITIALGLCGFYMLKFHGFGDGYIGRVVYAGIPSALIVYGAIAVRGAPKRGIAKIAEALGAASYSIYLIHLTLFMVIRHWATQADFQITTSLEYWSAYSFLVVIACAIGYLVYKYIETPVTNRLNNYVRKRG